MCLQVCPLTLPFQLTYYRLCETKRCVACLKLLAGRMLIKHFFLQQINKTNQLRNLDQRPRNMLRRVRSCDQSQNGIFSFAFCFLDFVDNETTCFSPNIYSPETERRKDEQALISAYPLLHFSILRSLRFLHVPALLCSRNHDIIFVHRKGTWKTNYRQLLLTTYIH